jgi:hypothetical protein
MKDTRERLVKSRRWIVPTVFLAGYAVILIARGGSCETCLAGEFIPRTVLELPELNP